MRSLCSLAALPLLSISFVAACSSEGEYDELAGETAEDDVANADGKGDVAADGNYTFFAIRGDVRRCASPYCGGEFLSRLNRTTTVCHDGKASASCYTPELDFSESGLKQDAQDKLRLAVGEGAIGDGVKAIVRGRFARYGTAKGIAHDMGRFIVTEAWVAQSGAATDGVFVRVKDNGLRCIAAPCPSTGEAALNTSRTANISDIDFAPSGLTDEQVGEVMEAMFNPSGMIIAGDRFTHKVNGKTAKGRTATNVFVRVENAAQSEGCFVGGCSSQICSDQEGVISTCEFRPEYACYQQASCERQSDGACGWTQTAALDACLANN
jgi:hypothetical protein